MVTDRNRQIAAYIREKMPDTEHFYDGWHIAKGWSTQIFFLFYSFITLALLLKLYLCQKKLPNENFVLLGIGKKIEALGKRKGCEDVGLWTKSIKNHIYWLGSAGGKDEDLKEAMFNSIIDHCCNIHNHDNDLFPACLHEPLDNDDREWLQPGMVKCYKFPICMLHCISTYFLFRTAFWYLVLQAMYTCFIV